MYHIIGTVEQMEALSASIMDCIPREIVERLKQRIETLQECYGADRDLEADLGGYVVLFPSMTLEKKTEYRNILEKCFLQDLFAANLAVNSNYRLPECIISI